MKTTLPPRPFARRALPLGLAVGWLLGPACGGAPPPAPPAAVTASASVPAPSPPLVTEPPDRAPEPAPAPCAGNPERENPVADDELGSGPRVVRIINTSSVEIRARLINAERKPAVDGTLRIAAGGAGTFKVGEGSYAVRYRLESSCQVFEGSLVRLTGPRAGVEIALSAIFEQGRTHGVRQVSDEL